MAEVEWHDILINCKDLTPDNTGTMRPGFNFEVGRLNQGFRIEVRFVKDSISNELWKTKEDLISAIRLDESIVDHEGVRQKVEQRILEIEASET